MSVIAQIREREINEAQKRIEAEKQRKQQLL